MIDPNTDTRPTRTGHGQQPAYLTQNEAADYLRISPRTLERHRSTGTGPRFSRLGRRVVYAVSELDAFAASRTYASTAEADAGASNKI